MWRQEGRIFRTWSSGIERDAWCGRVFIPANEGSCVVVQVVVQ